jgi:hypothetical protein
MSNPITLAAIKIGGESISITLIQPPGDEPATVSITWPKKSLSISPRRFPDVAATIARLFANASTELARMHAQDRRRR